MNSVTKNAGLPQMRCKSIAGGSNPTAFRYEVRVMGRWITSNYQFARWVVEEGHRLLRTGRAGL